MATSLSWFRPRPENGSGAAVLDWLAAGGRPGGPFAIGFAGITRTPKRRLHRLRHRSLVLFGSIGLGLTLVYLVVLPGIEGRSGSTIGNRLMGIRSTDADGYAPGDGRGVPARPHHRRRHAAGRAGRRRRRDLPMVRHAPCWHRSGRWRCSCGAWAVLVVLSSAWDQRTAPRLQGHRPLDRAPVQPIASSCRCRIPPGRSTAAGVAGGIQGARTASRPLRDRPPLLSSAGCSSAAVRRRRSPAPAQPAAAAPAVRSARTTGSPRHPASVRAPAGRRPSGPHDQDRTQVRGDTDAPVTVAVLRIRLDDGRDFQLDRNVLIGRNPAGQRGEAAGAAAGRSRIPAGRFPRPTSTCSPTAQASG